MFSWGSAVDVKDGEGLLFGLFDTEVVVSDSVPLAVEHTDKAHNEAEWQTGSKAGEAHHMHGVESLLRGLCKNMETLNMCVSPQTTCFLTAEEMCW